MKVMMMINGLIDQVVFDVKNNVLLNDHRIPAKHNDMLFIKRVGIKKYIHKKQQKKESLLKQNKEFRPNKCSNFH